MNTSIQILEIKASVEKVWEVLFNQYGDIHIHNPTMQDSNYMDSAAKGGLSVMRHCQFTDKLFLDEKITEYKKNDSVRIEAVKHNLPMLDHLSATYELKSLGNDRTEVKMTSLNSASPGFMIHLIKGRLRKNVGQHLFGMKYFIETGKTVDMKNYTKVYKRYR
mgnify:CR=1 FL=1